MIARAWAISEQTFPAVAQLVKRISLSQAPKAVLPLSQYAPVYTNAMLLDMMLSGLPNMVVLMNQTEVSAQLMSGAFLLTDKWIHFTVPWAYRTGVSGYIAFFPSCIVYSLLGGE